jgi:hypothetical protein
MKILGILLIAAGIILRLFRAISIRISLDIILVGVIFILAAYFLKKKAS